MGHFSRAYSHIKQTQHRRIAAFAFISIAINAIIAVVKISTSIYSLSFFLFINGLFNVGIGIAKLIAVLGYKKAQSRRRFAAIGAMTALSSVLYLAYCAWMITENSAVVGYDDITAITIATVSFTEIFVAVYGAIRIRRNNSPMLYAIKLTNLTAALTSIVLTQSALLSLDGIADITKYSGIVGVIIAFICVLISVYMMTYCVKPRT